MLVAAADHVVHLADVGHNGGGPVTHLDFLLGDHRSAAGRAVAGDLEEAGAVVLEVKTEASYSARASAPPDNDAHREDSVRTRIWALVSIADNDQRLLLYAGLWRLRDLAATPWCAAAMLETTQRGRYNRP